MITRFRIGTYIDDEGGEMWEVERYHDHFDDEREHRWILHQTSLETRERAVTSVDLFRKKESHTTKWEEI